MLRRIEDQIHQYIIGTIVKLGGVINSQEHKSQGNELIEVSKIMLITGCSESAKGDKCKV